MRRAEVTTLRTKEPTAVEVLAEAFRLRATCKVLSQRLCAARGVELAHPALSVTALREQAESLGDTIDLLEQGTLDRGALKGIGLRERQEDLRQQRLLLERLAAAAAIFARRSGWPER
jgi:hypothetical protein